jgi:dTDP-4-dehydrorhamnose 3,5-epimerase
MQPEVFCGKRHTDQRGELDFFNSLDMAPVMRMYRIKPANTLVIRAWQGHALEHKWFYCLKGAFVVNLIPLSEIITTPSSVVPEIYTLQANRQEILRIPAGFVNGFRALLPESELLVFSDKTLEESKKDDYRFSLEDLSFKEPNKQL